MDASGVPAAARLPRGARRAVLLGVTLALSACGPIPFLTSRSDPAPEPVDPYTLLPDTTICVVDRTTARGLRPLHAKLSQENGVVLQISGQVLPLGELHPVRAASGYAGEEPWFRRNEPIRHAGRRFEPVPEERRIAVEQLQQLGEHAGVPLFGAPGERPPPQAVYVPVRPGCVFRAYVRADLLR